MEARVSLVQNQRDVGKESGLSTAEPLGAGNIFRDTTFLQEVSGM